MRFIFFVVSRLQFFSCPAGQSLLPGILHFQLLEMPMSALQRLVWPRAGVDHVLRPLAVVMPATWGVLRSRALAEREQEMLEEHPQHHLT